MTKEDFLAELKIYDDRIIEAGQDCDIFLWTLFI